MSGRGATSWLAVAFAWWTGCAAPDEAVRASLPPGAVARVGSRQLPAAGLQALQRARPEQSARALLEQWATQARWAEASLAAGLPNHADTLALVRRLYAGWRADAMVHEFTADELARIRALEWQRYDRPRAVRAHHAVAMPARGATPAPDALEQFAAALHAAVQGATDFVSFEAAAKALDVPLGIELRVEVLPAMTAEGRALEGDAGFDPSFAAAAAALPEALAISEAVRTPFGVHVIQAEEVLPAMHLDDRAMRELLQEQRALWLTRLWQSDALDRQRARVAVRLAKDADAGLELAVQRVVGEESEP